MFILLDKLKMSFLKLKKKKKELQLHPPKLPNVCNSD